MAKEEEQELLQVSGIKKLIKDGCIGGIERTYFTKDGGKVPVVFSGSVMRDKEGGIHGIICVASDISELKRMQVNLIQAQKMEGIGLLAGGVAHDLNTHLGTILGYGDMMRDNIPEGTRARDYLEKLIMAGKRSKELLRQLLDFAQPSEGGRKPERLAPIVEKAYRLLCASLPKTITIRLNINADSGIVLANSSQLQQVITNIGMNAGNAIGEKEGTLEVSLAESEMDADLASLHEVKEELYLRISIRDTGCGMKPKVLNSIFEPFFTTKDVGKGSGLGLAVTHGIINSHGGFITVDSESGKGSLFQIYLPKIQ